MKEDYYQPNFYKFSEESILLVNYSVKNLVIKNNMKVLDAFSGCGVIGIDLVKKSNFKINLFQNEIQPEMISNLNKNLELFEVESTLLKGNYMDMSFNEKFDLILMNPPYYDISSGKKPKELNKIICKFINIENWILLLRKTLELMKVNSHCCMLLSPLQQNIYFQTKSFIEKNNLNLNEVRLSEKTNLLDFYIS